MAEVTRRLEIAAPAQQVWATIADFAAVERYSPMVRECALEGPDGVGQLRHLTLDNGTVTTSRLAAIDPAARTLRYEILVTKLPLADYSSTMVVRELAAQRCEVIWSSQFRPSGASEDEACGFLERNLGDGLHELRKLHEGPAGRES